MAKLNHKMVVISILDNFRKESLLISTPKTKVSILSAKNISIAIIGTNAY